MAFENDFAEIELVEFEIEGRKFKYKPTTAGDENDWLPEYAGYDEDGKFYQRLDKLNELKIKNLKEVPYSQETIKKVIGIDKEWKDLNHDQRWNLIKKLKPKMFDLIIREINKLDSGDKQVKKN